MKKFIGLVIFVILFLIVGYYAVLKNDSSSSVKVEDAFQEAVYHGSYASTISTNSGQSYGTGYSLGKTDTNEHVKQLVVDNNLDNYIEKEDKQLEYVRLFEIASMILMPDMRGLDKIGTERNIDYFLTDIKNGNEEELEYEGGVIKLKRGNNTEYLTYIPIDQYEQYKNEDNLEQLKKHFTLSSEGNIIVIGWKEVKEETTTTKDGVQQGDTIVNTNREYKDIVYNYKDILKQYEVPYSFIYNLLVYGNENTEFSYEVAKYVIENTDVVIGIYDDETTTVETITTSYKDKIIIDGKLKNNFTITEFKENENGYYIGPAVFSDPKHEIVVNYETTKVTTTTEVISTIDIEKADLWCISYTNEYAVQEPSTVTVGPNSYVETNQETTKKRYTNISTDYEFYNEIKYKIDERDTANKEAVKKYIIRDELKKHFIVNALHGNPYYVYMKQMTLEFLPLIEQTEALTQETVKQLYAEALIEAIEDRNARYVDSILTNVPSAPPTAPITQLPTDSTDQRYKDAVEKIVENIISFKTEKHPTRDYNDRIENWQQYITINETREKTDITVTSTIETTTTKCKKENSSFTEKTDTDASTANNFVKIYKKYNPKIEYSWLEEQIEEDNIPEANKDILRYMMQVAIKGKKDENIVIDGIKVSSSVFQKENEIVNGLNGITTNLPKADLIVDTSVVQSMISKLSNEKAKQDLTANIEKIMAYQENYKINAVFVIAAIDTEYDGVAEDAQVTIVSEFLDKIKEIKLNGTEKIKDIPDTDENWQNTVTTKMLELYTNQGITVTGEFAQSGDGYPNMYVSNSGYTYYNYKQCGEPAASYADMIFAYGENGNPWIMSGQGCFFTAITTCISGKTGKDINPVQAIKEVEGTGKIAGQPFNPSYWWSTQLEFYGLSYEIIEYKDINVLINHLKTGQPAIVYVLAESDYTDRQHYMAVLDIDLSNNNLVYLSNPSNSGEKTGWQDINKVLTDCQTMYLIKF